MRHAIFLLPAVLSMALASGLALLPAAARADPPRTPSVTCTGGGMSEPAKFTQVSPGRAEYHFSGVCIHRNGQSFGYRVAATWTPSEANPQNANASEIYRIDALSGPSQSFDVVVGARCDRDPWLHGVNCTHVGDNIPDELRALWPDFADSPFPYSRRGIPYDQRPALLAEYERANGASDRLPSPINRLRRRVDGVRFASPATRSIGSVAHAADQMSLNPQPLPPGPPDARLTRSARSRIDTVTLNPQPLPPGPPDPEMAQSASSRAAQSGIIIVSGRPLRLRADTRPLTDTPIH